MAQRFFRKDRRTKRKITSTCSGYYRLIHIIIAYLILCKWSVKNHFILYRETIFCLTVLQKLQIYQSKQSANQNQLILRKSKQKQINGNWKFSSAKSVLWMVQFSPKLLNPRMALERKYWFELSFFALFLCVKIDKRIRSPIFRIRYVLDQQSLNQSWQFKWSINFYFMSVNMNVI